MESRLAAIVMFLNAEETRATYGAVAGVLGVPAISMGARLGDHSLEKSWIVSAKAPCMPTGYAGHHIHPKLRSSEIITTAVELQRRMDAATEHRP